MRVYQKIFRNWQHDTIAHVEIATHHPIINLKVELDECDEDSTIKFIISAWIFIFIGFNVKAKWFWNLLRKINKPNAANSKYVEREMGFSFSDWTLRLSIWEDSTGWSRYNPRWWCFIINFKDIVLGKQSHSKCYLDEKIIDVPLREGIYSCLIQQVESTWSYQRFNKLAERKVIRYDCTFGKEVKCNDKWDKWRYVGKYNFSCDDWKDDGRNKFYFKEIPVPATSKPKWNSNSTYSMCGFHKAKDINDAASMLLQDLFKARLNYYGNEYMPNGTE